MRPDPSARYAVMSSDTLTITLHSIGVPGNTIHVSFEDRDLIFEPTADDLQLAEAFERGEIEAFEYPISYDVADEHSLNKMATRTRLAARFGSGLSFEVCSASSKFVEFGAWLCR
jgi:hypothetical protein